ncbi:sugar ABC transporter substrate-binding protein [Capsulimonas corticalis]|uniref:Sugar ABC transporter substrate-binding protein n=1 Tax=Capsulimonas corticalis TaxID=2219043 RepID=A0A402D3Z8_9BACT|nr:sugar-binding protein [Capsulimonas corticalis]BDI29712.1 sugar ABC transporter substrate-binding protein [Capsulimonas corticalis]
MKINRREFCLTLAAGSVAGLAGCGRRPLSAGAPSPAGKTIQLAIITNGNSDFWTVARDGAEAALKSLPNVTLDFRIPDELTAAGQKRVVDDLIARGVDGVAISPLDQKNQQEMLDGAAAKLLLVTLDADAPASKRACYIGTDDVDAGRQAGKTLLKAMPKGGKVLCFVGVIDAQNAQDRLNGLKDAVQGSNITIVDVRTDGGDTAKAKANAADGLVKYPDLAGMVGLWSYNGPAILNAVQDAGKVGKIAIVCFDEQPETLAGVKGGAIFATVVQQPYAFTHDAISIMAKYLGGDKSVIPADKKIIYPTLVIQKDSVDDFAQKLQTMRGRS